MKKYGLGWYTLAGRGVSIRIRKRNYLDSYAEEFYFDYIWHYLHQDSERIIIIIIKNVYFVSQNSETSEIAIDISLE